MSRKRDFSDIGKNILRSNEKPSSLSDLIDVAHNNESNNTQIFDPKKEHLGNLVVKSSNHIIRECISMSKSDADMVDELAVKCAAEGQKTTKADVYRASIRYFSKLSPSVMASKIRDVRKDKKTHN